MTLLRVSEQVVKTYAGLNAHEFVPWHSPQTSELSSGLSSEIKFDLNEIMDVVESSK